MSTNFIKCPACDIHISDKATVCPHCHSEIYTYGEYQGTVIALGAGVLTGVAAGWLGGLLVVGVPLGFINETLQAWGGGIAGFVLSIVLAREFGVMFYETGIPKTAACRPGEERINPPSAEAGPGTRKTALIAGAVITVFLTVINTDFGTFTRTSTPTTVSAREEVRAPINYTTVRPAILAEGWAPLNRGADTIPYVRGERTFPEEQFVDEGTLALEFVRGDQVRQITLIDIGNGQYQVEQDRVVSRAVADQSHQAARQHFGS